jgi:uncharacterized RDD family membrane protein YckC
MSLHFSYASKLKRAFNFIIDFSLIIVFTILTGLFFEEKMIFFSAYFWSTLNIYTVLYYWVMEANFRGRTVGKLITKTMAITDTGNEITYLDAFARTLLRAIPFDIISIFFKKKTTWHDQFSKTVVVEYKGTFNPAIMNTTIMMPSNSSYKSGSLYK